MGEENGSKSNISDCGSRYPGFRPLPDSQTQRAGGTGISHKPRGASASAVLDGAVYLSAV